MNRYRIVYEQEAAAGLMLVYQRAADAAAVTAALDAVEATLASRPREMVQVLREGLLAVERGPIRVVYEVRERERTVHLGSINLLHGHAGWSRPGGASGPK